ncbi:tetratricopeptide repeat protein [Micromonospora sp. ATCC 39149]|nr:tetratricopeptide repeat protein [Micromonospora sp. ATCC 39149]
MAINQVLDNGRLSWPWLVAAVSIALLTVVLDRRLSAAGEPGAVRDSDLELSAVTLTQAGHPRDSRANIDLKLRNTGGQPAILHRATFHIHDAVSLSPHHLVGFLPYEEFWVRGVLHVSATYDLALPEVEQAAGSRQELDLSQAIEPAGTDRFHIRLGIPPTQDTLIYRLHFDIHYDAHRTVTSQALVIAHPPGSWLVTPDEIRRDLHRFRQAVRQVRDAIDREMTARGVPIPDWDSHPPAGREDLPANLLSVDGDAEYPLGADPRRGIYEVNDAFWNPEDSLTRHLRDIRDYCARVVAIITGVDNRDDSLPLVLAQAQAIIDQLPALAAEFSAPEKMITGQDHAGSGSPDTTDELLRLLGRQQLEELRARASAGELDAAHQLNSAFGLVDKIRRLGPDHPEALNARETLIFWRVGGDKAGAAVALAELIPDQLRVHGPDHPRTLDARHHLAMCRGETGDPAGAAAALAELVPARERALGPDHPDTLNSRHELARWRAMAGDPVGAGEAFAELVADRTRVQGPDHPTTLYARHNLAVCRGKAGDAAGAAAALAELVADRRRVLGPDHPDTVTSQRELTRWQNQAGATS